MAWCALYVERRIQEQDEAIVEPELHRQIHQNSISNLPKFTMVGSLPLPVFLLLVGLGTVPVMFWLTRKGMPWWLRDAFVLPAFISSIIWFEVAADELIEALRAFGHILDLRLVLYQLHSPVLSPELMLCVCL